IAAGSEKMFPQKTGVKPAARPGILRRIAREYAGAAQAIEIRGRQFLLFPQDAGNGRAQPCVAFQREQKPAQMIAKGTFVAIRLRLDRRKIKLVFRHLVKAALRQIRMAAHQIEIALNFRLIKRRAVTAVEFSDLLNGEVFEYQPRADIERRLVEIA